MNPEPVPHPRPPGRAAASTLSIALLWATAACGSTAGQQTQLERVARDWCQTIRASQILPAYPLTEDIQPGDVFVVPLPIARQAELFDEKGFLPLDQRVVRLHGLPFDRFYGDAYWKGTYAGAPHDRPGWSEGSPAAPRAAFPSYTFSVQRSAGLALALPLSSVPVGLGLLGADRARGSVTLNDAYTYGVDVTSVAPLLAAWAEDPAVRETLMRVATDSSDEVFLRIVTQVFLVRTLDVTVSRLSSGSAGLDAGAAPEIALMDLSALDVDDPAAAVAAHRIAMEALEDRISGLDAGGGLRLAQASGRSISLRETFDRPLVVGYQAFDVKIFPSGDLSAPIPSFTTLASAAEGEPIEWSLEPLEVGLDMNSALLEAWLDGSDRNALALRQWLNENGLDESTVLTMDFVDGAAFAAQRRAAVRHFGLRGGR